MKKVLLIEWGIITIALIFGYKFFESIFTALVQIFYTLQGMPGGFFEMLLPTVFLIIIYAVSFTLLIKRSRQLAIYLNGNKEDETIPIKVGKKALLQVILVSICLGTIISNIPQIILYLFDSFKDQVSSHNADTLTIESSAWHKFKLSLIQIIVAFVLIFFSKEISNWFIRKNEIDELTFETEPENEDK